MKTLISSEELILFIWAIILFTQLPFAWWWFLVLLLLPDISMLGYLAGNRVGAWTYNLAHHRGIAIAIYLLGGYLSVPLLQLAGLVLFAHSTMDRMVGYGLKYEKGFRYTHLGEVGS